MEACVSTGLAPARRGMTRWALPGLHSARSCSRCDKVPRGDLNTREPGLKSRISLEKPPSALVRPLLYMLYQVTTWRFFRQDRGRRRLEASDGRKKTRKIALDSIELAPLVAKSTQKGVLPRPRTLRLDRVKHTRHSRRARNFTPTPPFDKVPSLGAPALSIHLG